MAEAVRGQRRFAGVVLLMATAVSSLCAPLPGWEDLLAFVASGGAWLLLIGQREAGELNERFGPQVSERCLRIRCVEWRPQDSGLSGFQRGVHLLHEDKEKLGFQISLLGVGPQAGIFLPSWLPRRFREYCRRCWAGPDLFSVSVEFAHSSTGGLARDFSARLVREIRRRIVGDWRTVAPRPLTILSDFIVANGPLPLCLGVRLTNSITNATAESSEVAYFMSGHGSAFGTMSHLIANGVSFRHMEAWPLWPQIVQSPPDPHMLPNPMDDNRYWVPVMSLEEMAKYTVSFDDVGTRLRTVLSEHGIAVVTGVAPPSEVVELEQLFKKDLTDLVDMRALRNSSARVQRAFRHFLKGRGVDLFPVATAEKLGLRLSALSQGRFAWHVRRSLRVHDVFRALFSHSVGLVTGMDAPTFTAVGTASEWASAFSAHADQNLHDSRFPMQGLPGLADCESFQGALYVSAPLNDGAGSTTVVWPGSHRDVWQRMMDEGGFEQPERRSFQYCDVQGMRNVDVARELAAGWTRHAKRVTVPAGALLLWNSRTLHASWSSGSRLAQFVSFQPAEFRPPEERFAKLRLAALGLAAGSHWPSLGVQHDSLIRGLRSHVRFPVSEPASEGTGGIRGVVLPLHPRARPWPLARAVDEAQLKKLLSVRLEAEPFGSWRASAGEAALLEAALDPAVAQLL